MLGRGLVLLAALAAGASAFTLTFQNNCDESAFWAAVSPGASS